MEEFKNKIMFDTLNKIREEKEKHMNLIEHSKSIKLGFKWLSLSEDIKAIDRVILILKAENKSES